MAVHLIGLDEVGEHEAALQGVDQLRGRRDRRRVGRPLVLMVDPDAVEHLADLAHRVDRHAVRLQLLHVGAGGRRQRDVLAAVGAYERARLAAERPRDHPSDGVLTRHDLPHRRADRVQLRERHLVDVEETK